jgi:hypothetical protein
VRRAEHSCCDLHLLYEVRKHCPQALAEGLLRRVRENRPLVYGADNILAAAWPAKTTQCSPSCWKSQTATMTVQRINQRINELLRQSPSLRTCWS